ncbi:hypothetical protein, partial [Staphylococcus epidermidis]|uniref:hypothetical protein n=1 Tax=Staphylococcus epidermidis TaxID=1282 RepID=UPI00311D8E9A
VEVPKKATPTDDKQPARSHQVKLEIKATKDEQFWVGWTWDAKKPQYLVILQLSQQRERIPTRCDQDAGDQSHSWRRWWWCDGGESVLKIYA